MKTFSELNNAEILSIKRRKQKGLTNGEIADIIGCSIMTVKMALMPQTSTNVTTTSRHHNL